MLAHPPRRVLVAAKARIRCTNAISDVPTQSQTVDISTEATARPLVPGHLTKEQEELVAHGKLSEDYLPDDFEARTAMIERHPDLQDCMAFRTCEPEDKNWHPKSLPPVRERRKACQEWQPKPSRS